MPDKYVFNSKKKVVTFIRNRFMSSIQNNFPNTYIVCKESNSLKKKPM